MSDRSVIPATNATSAGSSIPTARSKGKDAQQAIPSACIAPRRIAGELTLPRVRDRWDELARELAERDAGLHDDLRQAWESAVALRERAASAVARFSRAASAAGADHLCDIVVSAVGPDQKHVDCVQFRVARGRFEILCVAKAKGSLTLVGPFKRGGTEGPCSDCPLSGREVEEALDARVEALIRQASDR